MFNIRDIINEAIDGWVMFSDLSFEGKIARLATLPYDSSKFYHVTDADNINNIMQNGITGDEVWVSAGKPWKNYINGYCLELDLTDVEKYPDVRWKEEDGIYIINGGIEPDRILKAYEYLDNIDMREDIFADNSTARDLSDEKIGELITKYRL